MSRKAFFQPWLFALLFLARVPAPQAAQFFCADALSLGRWLYPLDGVLRDLDEIAVQVDSSRQNAEYRELLGHYLKLLKGQADQGTGPIWNALYAEKDIERYLDGKTGVPLNAFKTLKIDPATRKRVVGKRLVDRVAVLRLKEGKRIEDALEEIVPSRKPDLVLWIFASHLHRMVRYNRESIQRTREFLRSMASEDGWNLISVNLHEESHPNSNVGRRLLPSRDPISSSIRLGRPIGGVDVMFKTDSEGGISAAYLIPWKVDSIALGR